MDSRSNGAGLGARAQDIRKRRGWTLAQVSERSGLSPSALSKIERDKISPTYANLVRLARGLDVSTSALFGEPSNDSVLDGKLSVMKFDDGDVVNTGIYDYSYLHMRLSTRVMTPILTNINARSLEEFGPMISHSGEEFTYVLSGIIELRVGDQPPIRLSPGESVYFDSNLPHAYLAASRTPCRALSVCSNLDQHQIEALLNKNILLA